MSSQFSYELDERQIRIMMQNAELDYTDALWNKFDELSVSQNKVTANVGAFIPNFNLSISRSIIVPVIFIVLIGGLSAMLFSFVDFKKKESIEKEIPYVAKLETVKKPTIQAKAVVKPKLVETKIAITPIIADSLGPKPKTALASANLPVAKKEEPKVAEIKQPIVVLKPTEEKKQPVVQQKKRKKKVNTEELPTINAATTTNLNEGATEPELDLK
jgi:hypothetical protein